MSIDGARRNTARPPTRAGWLWPAVATVAITIASPAVAQISPGPLSRAHEKLEGALNCLSCHGSGSDAQRDRCVTCHKEISWLVDRRKGLHGQAGNEECSRCHAEHAGRDATLIRFAEGDPARFDHDTAGWRLAGRHRELECKACHTPRYHVSEAARLLERKDLSASYLGLESECVACHSDVHRGALGPECKGCHDAGKWRPAPRFDHARTSYALTGQHAEVTCEKCHGVTRAVAADDTLGAKVSFAPVRHGECRDCHKDPHESRLGTVCSTCHVTDGFRSIVGQQFDHARTGYPLKGRHRDVRCEKCHRGAAVDGSSLRRVSAGASVLRPRHARCTDCHTDDHGGQLADRPGGAECGSCHRVEGWKPSTYPAEEHARLDLALQGRHATIECASCHAPGERRLPRDVSVSSLGRARVPLGLLDTECESCHQDPHRGRFSEGGSLELKNGCGGCHTADAWRPSTVNAQKHEGLGFQLRGAHQKTRCEECHRPARPQPMKASMRPGEITRQAPDFTIENRTCAACHKTPHGDQFADRRDGGACESCHGESAFKPADGFSHDRGTRFPLLRSHADAKCAECHDSRINAFGETLVVYRPLSLSCRDCHLSKGLTAKGRPVRPDEPSPARSSRRKRR